MQANFLKSFFTKLTSKSERKDTKKVFSPRSYSSFLRAAALDIDWPLRGAIAYGECVMDRNTRTFIGQPIIDAYELEESQKWIGTAFHESVVNHSSLKKGILQLDEVIQYNIPVKAGIKSTSYALNWYAYGSNSEAILNKHIGMAYSTKVTTYYKNTLKYVLSESGK